MSLKQINPNVAIVGAVSGFALYLLWKWTQPSEDGRTVHDRVAEGVAETMDDRAEEMLVVGRELPFSPMWWADKIRNAYNEIR